MDINPRKKSLPGNEVMTQMNKSSAKKRSLVAACLTHALHDGYTDSLYAFLPVWQSQFGLSYAQLAIMRALYFATMGGLQIPADRVLRGYSARRALILSTFVASFGLLIMALPLGFSSLCVGLVIAGIGSSVQHPRGSTLITDNYSESSRRALGIYNFSGDLGKAILPAAIAILLPLLHWQTVICSVAMLGIVLVAILTMLIPARPVREDGPREQRAFQGARSGFRILTLIGGLDTATRMGYLLFLPFLVQGQGGGSPTVGIALALIFIGGAFGKAVFGWLSETFGAVRSVMAAETTTALLITATLFTPLPVTLILLPGLGTFLNGTSSVLYAAVPELSDGDKGRAFAIFYTSVIGSGGLAPILYGLVADYSNQMVGVLASALTAASIVPLVLMLRRHMREGSDRNAK